jgi:hypothetical protein
LEGKEGKDMSILFNPDCEGSWSISSKSDPRWNTSGHIDYSPFTMGEIPEVTAAVKRLTKKYEKHPKDLMVSYLKD